jgi:heat shock protein HtpX
LGAADRNARREIPVSKRILLFVATNIAIIATLSIVWAAVSAVLGRSATPGGLVGLAAFCLFWGMGGAFISLAISRWVAKTAMGVRLVDGRTGDRALDDLHATVGRLSRQAGLPTMPEVGVYESDEVNAFATGPTKSRALVAVSTGLLRRMRLEEVEGVLGHEIAHVANGDMVTMTLIQGVVNAFVMFVSRIIAWAVRQAVDSRIAGLVSLLVLIVSQVVLGMLGMMVVAWFSRQREFRADAGGAGLTGRERMIAALRRLQSSMDVVDNREPALAAFKISGRPSGFLALFSTHPPLEARIAALEGRTA